MSAVCVFEVPSQAKALGMDSGLSDSIEATMSIIQQSLSARTQVCVLVVLVALLCLCVNSD